MLLMTQHSSVAGTFLASWSWQCHLTYKDLDKTKRRNTLRVGAINPKIFRSNKPWAMIQRQHPYLKSFACNYFIASYLGVILVYCDTSEAEVSTWSPRKHDHNHLITNHAWGLSVTHGVVFFFFTMAVTFFLEYPLLNFCSSPLKHLKFLGIWEKWLIASIDFSKVRKHGGMKQWIGNSKFPLYVQFLKGILRWLSRQNVSEFLNIKKFFIPCLKVTNAHIYISVLASYGTEKSCLDVSKLDKLFRRRFQLFFSCMCWTKKTKCRDICSFYALCIFICISLNDHSLLIFHGIPEVPFLGEW